MFSKIFTLSFATAALAASALAAPVIASGSEERAVADGYTRIANARIGIPISSNSSTSTSTTTTSSSSAAANDASTADTTSSDSTTARKCSPSGVRGVDNGIMSPAEGASVVAGQNFTLSYCSNAFHESRSISYSVMATVSGDMSSGIYLATKVKTSEVSISIPSTVYDVLVVLEKQQISGQDNYQYSMFSHNITVTEAS